MHPDKSLYQRLTIRLKSCASLMNLSLPTLFSIYFTEGKGPFGTGAVLGRRLFRRVNSRNNSRHTSRKNNRGAYQPGRHTPSILDREYFVRMQFFQYMIANCDWGLTNRHNLQLVKLPNQERAEVIAYDFDYSGFVGSGYAVPSPSLPIKSVQERYFFPYPTTDEEIDQAIAYFLEQEAAIYATCTAADYLSVKEREKCQHYLRSFFDLLRNPKRFKRRIGQ